MFINFSNHASTRWGVPQKQAAKKYGEIVDVQFPNVNPEATSEEVHELARVCAEKIMEMKPECVLCQGRILPVLSGDPEIEEGRNQSGSGMQRTKDRREEDRK